MTQPIGGGVITQVAVPEIAGAMGCAEGTVKATLHSALAKASGDWIVTIRLNSQERRVWDQVASEYFHRKLAVDLDDVIVTAPLIEPTNRSFSSFDGVMQLFAFSSNDAYDLAAALSSGPLVVPLVAGSHPTASTVKS